MTTYDTFGDAYELVVGTRPYLSRFVRKLLKQYAPRARTLLELGCGSGAMLQPLSRYYKCTGIDASSTMLKLARRTVPQAELINADISSFELGRTFDSIICVFDTINHLPSFGAWASAFACARRHLNPGGVFILDMNTSRKLDRCADEPPMAQIVGDVATLVQIVKEAKGRYLVRLQAFEPVKRDIYRLRELTIRELTFSSERVTKELRKRYRKIHQIDMDRKRPSTLTEEMFFVCVVG